MIFYDWNTAKVIRKIDLAPRKVYWNDATSLVMLVTAEDFYVLSYNSQVIFFDKGERVT